MQPKTKTILFIIFSFLLGVFCGVMISFNLFVPKKPLTHAEFMKIFQEHVKLSDTQLAKADSLFLSMKPIMDAHRQEMSHIKDSTRALVKDLLSPEQKLLFDQFYQDLNRNNNRKNETAAKDSSAEKKKQ
ncbi:MAG: hypothetical protein WAV76_02060 [Bacteroidota bacterium]